MSQQAGVPVGGGVVVRRPSRQARLRHLNDLVSQGFPAALVAALVALFVIIIAQSGGSVGANQLKNGLESGATYALIAVGYTMVYGIIELINFAHGDVFTLSALYSLLVIRFGNALGIDLDSLAHRELLGTAATGFFSALLIVLLFSMLMAGLTGVIIERVAYRPLRNAPRLAPLITAIGVSFFLEGMMQARAGSANVQTPINEWIRRDPVSIFGFKLQWDVVTIYWTDLFVVAAAVLLMFLLQSFVRYSKLGKAMRATAQERDAALLSGININRTIAATFFIGSALAAAGAIVYSIYQGRVVWNLGFQFGIIAFTAAVLGGIGNILGAGLGGFLIGLFQVFGSQLLGAQWANSIIFAMLIIILTFRPVGLLGMRVPDRA